MQIPITVARSGDLEGPALTASKIVDQLPSGNLELYSDLTHFAPMEDPSRIAKSIMETLNKVL